MILSSTTRKQGQRGCRPFPLHPQSRRAASASLRTISLDDSEHLRHNHGVSVASLRLLFTFAPECRSASLRNRCSPSPEYPVWIVRSSHLVDGHRHGNRAARPYECRRIFHAVRSHVIQCSPIILVPPDAPIANTLEQFFEFLQTKWFSRGLHDNSLSA